MYCSGASLDHAEASNISISKHGTHTHHSKQTKKQKPLFVLTPYNLSITSTKPKTDPSFLASMGTRTEEKRLYGIVVTQNPVKPFRHLYTYIDDLST